MGGRGGTIAGKASKNNTQQATAPDATRYYDTLAPGDAEDFLDDMWDYNVSTRRAINQYIREDPGSGGYTMSQNMNHRLETGQALNANEQYTYDKMMDAMKPIGRDLTLTRAEHQDVLERLGVKNYSSMTESQLQQALVGKTYSNILNLFVERSIRRGAFFIPKFTTLRGRKEHAGHEGRAKKCCLKMQTIFTVTSASFACGKASKSMNTGASYMSNEGDAFVIGNDAPDRSNAFRVTYAGAVYALSAFNASGADYAEYIKEWFDGNPDGEDRVGYFVTVKDGLLHKADAGDIIVGITSGNPSVVGNLDEDYHARWERDDFGRIIWEDVEEEVIEHVEPEQNYTVDENGHRRPTRKTSEERLAERENRFVTKRPET